MQQSFIIGIFFHMTYRKAVHCLRFIAILLVFQSFSTMAINENTQKTKNIQVSKKRNVLILHSYPAYVGWTDSLQNTLNTLNRKVGSPFHFSVLYLEYYHRHNKNYEERVGELISEQLRILQEGKWEAVIAFDDLAAELVVKHQDDIANRDVKLFLIGVTEGLIDESQIKMDYELVFDEYDAQSIVQHLSDLKPNMESVHFIVDNTDFGDYMYSSIYPKLESQLSVPIKVTRYQPINELKQELSQYNSNQVVLLGSYRLKNGTDSHFYYSDKLIDALEPWNIKAPIFVVLDSYVRGGVLGGKVRSADVQATYAFERLESNLLYHDKMANSSFYRSFATSLFDYMALKDKKIALSSVPDNSLVLNQPVLLHDSDKMNLIIASIGLTFLFTLLLVKILYSRRNARLQNEMYQNQLQLLNSQQDIIAKLGEVVETRSGETGKHIRRVSEVSSRLAKLYGLDSDIVNLIGIISPLHDVGKLSVPDSILNKPGKLTDEEFEEMKLHTTVGYELLKNTESEFINLAAIVAHEHHEKWNGRGYPLGKAGTDIHIYARIVAIADVFDALLSDRPYKKGWSPDRVFKLFKEERGEHFDPHLVDILLEHFDDFIVLRNSQ